MNEKSIDFIYIFIIYFDSFQFDFLYMRDIICLKLLDKKYNIFFEISYSDHPRSDRFSLLSRPKRTSRPMGGSDSC